MEVYLVRLKAGEPNAREIVGIFAAETMGQLFWMVDECCPPDECECQIIGPGGLYWERFTGQVVPRTEDPDWETLPDDWSELPPAPTLTGEWEDRFRPSNDEEWEPVLWPEDEDLDNVDLEAELTEAAELTPLPPRAPRRRVAVQRPRNR